MEKNETAKQRALDLALKQIEKTFGKGAIMRMGDVPDTRMIPFQPVRWRWMRLWV